MRIILTGANGFIGRYLLAGLLKAGHDVVPAVRNPRETDLLLPSPGSIYADFNRDVSPEVWLPRLRGIDAVVNCAGILQARPGQSIAAIYTEAPRALFEACEHAGVRRVVQISAISADVAAGTKYALTKASADAYLSASKLEWIVLRPSLVYGEGAFGGTALFRALAVLPFAIPVVGNGSQRFSPIHVDDLADALAKIIATPSITRLTIDPVGPDELTLRDILSDLRRWLGHRPARFISVPLPLARVAARLGDVLGGPINSTAIRQLEFGNTGAIEFFVDAVGITPRHWRDALLARPAQPQDRVHARLYFLRAPLRLAVAAKWFVSALSGILHPPVVEATVRILDHLLPAVVYELACVADAIVGMAVLLRWRPRVAAVIQLLLVAFYTVFLTVAQPSLWFDPFGPLLKNIPFIASVLILAALESER